jgi:hypothetical protein
VKSLSLSKKKAARLIVTGIIAVSLFAAAIYYAVPNSLHFKTIAFALGSGQSNSKSLTVYMQSYILNVTLLNGTIWEGSYPNLAGELNSTDIEEIHFMPEPGYGGGNGFPGRYLATIEYAFDWGIPASVAGESIVDLGTLNVINYTFSFYEWHDSPLPTKSPPTLDYPLHVNATGYWNIGPLLYGPWTWQMNRSQIQSILPDGTDPVNITYNLNLNIHLFYQFTTEAGTQTGNATVQWGGPWGTLQLQHENETLLGLQYNFSEISLEMMAT